MKETQVKYHIENHKMHLCQLGPQQRASERLKRGFGKVPQRFGAALGMSPIETWLKLGELKTTAWLLDSLGPAQR